MKSNIEKIIGDIGNVTKTVNKTESIEALINANLRLSGYLYYLYEEKSEALQVYLNAYNLRKTEFARLSLNAEGNSQSEREKRAEIEVKEFRDFETKAEVILDRIKGICSSTESLIQVLTQKISYLKK